MRRISSRTTFYYKRIFPAFWFGVLAIVLVVALFAAWKSGSSQPLPFLIVPVLMALFGYFLMKKLVFDLVDEVFDAGDALLIENRGQQDRIALSDIMNVSYTVLINPPRVTLSLRTPSIFGSKVTFCAPIRLVPFATSPIINDLIERIDAKRTGPRT